MQKTVATSVLVVCVLGLGLSIRTSADVTPANGDQLPRAYYARRLQDPRAFTFRRALVQQAQRIRAARSVLMTRVAALPVDAAAKEVIAAADEIAVRGPRTIPVLPVLFKNTQGQPFNTTDLQSRLFGTRQYDECLLRAELVWTLTGDRHRAPLAPAPECRHDLRGR